MKLKVAGILSMLGGIIFGLFLFYALFDSQIKSTKGFFEWLYFLITSISIVFYVIRTNFGKKVYSEIEKIDQENNLLKLKIEQNELLQKLDKEEKNTNSKN